MEVTSQHGHARDDSRRANVPGVPISRVKSLETLLVKKGLVDPGALGDFGPRLGRSGEEVPEPMLVGAEPTWLIETARIDGSGVASPFEREADVRSAVRTEIKLQPAPRFI